MNSIGQDDQFLNSKADTLIAKSSWQINGSKMARRKKFPKNRQGKLISTSKPTKRSKYLRDKNL